MNVEVVKFKKLLEWFVEKLKVNNNIIFGEKDGLIKNFQ